MSSDSTCPTSPPAGPASTAPASSSAHGHDRAARARGGGQVVGKAGSGGRPIARGFDRAALRRLRLQAGMRQEDLAVASGVGRSQIARFESADGPVPVVGTLRALAAALGVAPTALLSAPPDGAQLVDLRYLAGFTQQQLADAVQVPRSTYSALERGALKLTEPWAQALAAALGVSVSAVRDAHLNSVTASEERGTK